jgi:FMN reductase
MTDALRIVGLGGSMAKVSRSRAALVVALEGAASAGARTELLDIRELDLPMYNPDDDAPTEAVTRLIEACHAADGMLWSSPMYQGTISGGLKNALDWLHLLRDREPAFLHDKVIGLISAAGGMQGLQAINTMEFAVRALRGWAVPFVVPVAAAARVFDADGEFASRPSRFSSRRSEQRSFASPGSSSPTSRSIARPSARKPPSGLPTPAAARGPGRSPTLTRCGVG